MELKFVHIAHETRIYEIQDFQVVTTLKYKFLETLSHVLKVYAYLIEGVLIII